MGPLVVVDGANVVGSVPDGWWRDRLGAARRLRDALAAVPTAGLRGVPGPVEVVLVVEGAAAPLAGEPSPGGVRVVAAPRSGSGDDAIVELVMAATTGESPGPAPGDASRPAPNDGPRSAPGDASRPAPARRCVVVTSDRVLRERVTTLGAEVVGPRALPYPAAKTS